MAPAPIEIARRRLAELAATNELRSTMRVDWQVVRDGTNYVVGDTLTCKKAA